MKLYDGEECDRERFDWEGYHRRNIMKRDIIGVAGHIFYFDHMPNPFRMVLYLCSIAWSNLRYSIRCTEVHGNDREETRKQV